MYHPSIPFVIVTCLSFPGWPRRRGTASLALAVAVGLDYAPSSSSVDVPGEPTPMPRLPCEIASEVECTLGDSTLQSEALPIVVNSVPFGFS